MKANRVADILQMFVDKRPNLTKMAHNRWTSAGLLGRDGGSLLTNRVTAEGFIAMSGTKEWFAVQLRSRFEKIVALHLRSKGYEEYLPLYRSRRRWSDRMKEIEVPLFPGYIFCKLDITDRLPLLVVPGVKFIVSSGRIPIPIPEHEIQGIQRVVDSGLHYGPWRSLCAGESVRVEYGPLRGVEGVVLRVKDEYQLIISITLLSRSVSVTIDRDCITPVNESRLNVTAV
jgi:transcription antitermination factor NusG